MTVNGKNLRNESSSSSSESEDEVDKKKQPDVVVPTDIEERPDAEVEKVIKVEEVTNQETSSDTPIMEKITGIFKREQSSSKVAITPTPPLRGGARRNYWGGASQNFSETKKIAIRKTKAWHLGNLYWHTFLIFLLFKII